MEPGSRARGALLKRTYKVDGGMEGRRRRQAARPCAQRAPARQFPSHRGLCRFPVREHHNPGLSGRPALSSQSFLGHHRWGSFTLQSVQGL